MKRLAMFLLVSFLAVPLYAQTVAAQNNTPPLNSGTVAATVDAVNVDNIKTIAGSSSAAMGMLYQAMAHNYALAAQNAVSHQNRMNVLAEAAVSYATKGVLTHPATAAAATERVVTAGDMGPLLAELGGILSAIQQMTKTAQTTPPETGQ